MWWWLIWCPLRRLVSALILCTSAKVSLMKVSLQVSVIFSSSFPSQEPHSASELMLTDSNIELIRPWRRALSACWVWIVCSTSGSKRAFEHPLVLSPGFALWCEVCGCSSSGSGPRSALGSARCSGSCSSLLLESPEGGGAGCGGCFLLQTHGGAGGHAHDVLFQEPKVPVTRRGGGLSGRGMGNLANLGAD